MTTVVILPGGFHPYHAGHYALYQSAQRAFPDADVYVAATDDRSTRPFPFAIKEKLAQLAGVEPGHFVQVKSPFQAAEITKNYDPEQDTVIFVRSEKDADQPPRAGGTKKDGSPAYLQPLIGAKKLQPFAKHAYMAYLPVVEFGPGMTSATEIRSAWPSLDQRRKTALVMSLYPKTQTNPRLAATVVKMLDTAIGGQVGETYDHTAVLAEGELATYLVSVMDSATGEHWRIEVKVTSPEMAKERAEAMGYKVLGVKEKGVAEGSNEFASESHTVGFIQEEDPDYIEEKWSQKYKSSINCANPKGFSQRAHCAGRKK